MCDLALDQCMTGPYNLANALSICIAVFSPALNKSHWRATFPCSPVAGHDMSSFGISAACLLIPTDLCLKNSNLVYHQAHTLIRGTFDTPDVLSSSLASEERD